MLRLDEMSVRRWDAGFGQSTYYLLARLPCHDTSVVQCLSIVFCGFDQCKLLQIKLGREW